MIGQESRDWLRFDWSDTLVQNHGFSNNAIKDQGKNKTQYRPTE